MIELMLQYFLLDEQVLQLVCWISFCKELTSMLLLEITKESILPSFLNASILKIKIFFKRFYRDLLFYIFGWFIHCYFKFKSHEIYKKIIKLQIGLAKKNERNKLIRAFSKR